MLLSIYIFAALNNAKAEEMCITEDAVPIVLDASSTSVTSFSNKVATTTWYASTNYGTFVGRSACLSSNYNTGWHGVYKANDGVLIDNGAVVVGGEYNSASNGTLYCWCKLIHPVVSLWVYYFSRSSVSSCITDCNYYCAYDFKNYDTSRKALIGSVTD